MKRYTRSRIYTEGSGSTRTAHFKRGLLNRKVYLSLQEAVKFGWCGLDRRRPYPRVNKWFLRLLAKYRHSRGYQENGYKRA